MPRTKRGPGAVQEETPSKRGRRAATRRSSAFGERIRAPNEDYPVLRDALGLPSSRPNSANTRGDTANIAVVGTAGDDEDAHWRTDFEPDEHRRPRITELSTPLEAGNEHVDFEVDRPREEGLGLSPLRDTARNRAESVPPGFASRNAITALEIVDLMEKRHRARDKEKRLYA